MSQGDPPIDGETVRLGALFLPEWVEEIFYAGQWFKIELGSFNDFVSDHGETTVYKDPFDGMVVILTQPVIGYKIRQPEPEPPKTNVVPLNKK